MLSKNLNYVDSEINGLKIIKFFSNGKRQYFECICVCNKVFITRTDAVKAGSVKSCGCLKADLISSKNRLLDNLGSINLVFRHYKFAAKKRDLGFFLSLEEFKKNIFSQCFYCGSEPTLSKFVSSTKGRRDRELLYNGIDRVNSDLGYIINNCVPCCFICNRAKSDLSLEEFRVWIKKIAKFNEK